MSKNYRSEKKSGNRFEPLIKFLKTLSQAEKIAVQGNPEGIQDFLKKIGSNFHIAKRTLTCQLRKPWCIARKRHIVLRGDTPDSFISGGSANWRCFLNEVRTLYEQNPQDFD